MLSVFGHIPSSVCLVATFDNVKNRVLPDHRFGRKGLVKGLVNRFSQKVED